MHVNWNDDRTKLLEALWSTGVSAAQIAANMGELTRNAVINKAHRLGLDSHTYHKTPRTRLRPMPRQLPQVEADDIPIEQRRTLCQLTPKSCRWPIGDPRSPEFYFCGATHVIGSSYCAIHERRAHR